VAPVLIVTGASAGIGASTARLAAIRGYAVCVNYPRHADAAAGIVGAIRNAGGEAIAVQADISSEADVVRLFQTAERELGPITGLMNNQRRNRYADNRTDKGSRGRRHPR